MSVTRCFSEKRDGVWVYWTLRGLARPMTREDVVWVATNRLIRRSYVASKRIGKAGTLMPSMTELREAAQRLVPV
jgi:hypothetical protein